MSIMKGKRVLITGASSGIGRACAGVFAAEGAELILIARRRELLEELSAELRQAHGTTSENIVLDVRRYEDVERALRDVDGVDVLINNAGLALGMGRVQEADPAHYDAMIDTNVKGLLYVTRRMVPKMIARGRGDIINIGSIAGHEVYPGGAVYCATKHAVDALTRGLRLDVVDTPLRVSSIDPGLVETEFSVVRFEGDRQKADNVYKGLEPLTGRDIADVALFIASRPAHVQIADVVIFPTAQAAATVVHRRG